jgi:outer membrane protein assembly factor BamB
MRYAFYLPAALLLVCSASRAGQDHWPRFRGPNGTGVSDATSVLVEWTDSDYAWQVELPGMGRSSPVVWGSHLFVTCADPRSAERRALCVDTATGRILWQRKYASAPHRMHAYNSYATATPAADANGVVLTWSTPEQVLLIALDNAGREVWRRDLGPYVGGHGSGSSPIIADGLVVLVNDQEDPKALASMYGPNPKMDAGRSFLIAVDRKTGRTRWKVERETKLSAYSTPCLSPSLDGGPEVIVTSTAHGITAVDLATGRVNWEIGGIFHDRCVGSPALAPGLVFASYGRGSRGSLLVAARPGARSKGQEPAIAYEVRKGVPLIPTPLVKDGRLFLWREDGTVTCLRAATGEILWRHRVRGSFFGSPVCVSDRLYCISMKGHVVVLAAGDRFEELARMALGQRSFATPAVAGGVMYLRTDSRLFAIGGPAR